MTDEMKKAAEEWEENNFDDYSKTAADAFEAGWTKCLETLAAKAGKFDQASLEEEIQKRLEPYTNWNESWPHDHLKGAIKGARWQHQQTALPLLAKIEMLEGKVKHGGEACHQKLIENLKLHMENQSFRERIKELEGNPSDTPQASSEGDE